MATQHHEVRVGNVVLLFRKMTPEEERRRDDDALWAQVPAHLRQHLADLADDPNVERRWAGLAGWCAGNLLALSHAQLLELALHVDGMLRCPERTPKT